MRADISVIEPGVEEFIFTFHSASDSIMSERKLLDSGLTVLVMPTPSALGPNCGICLRIKPGDLEPARVLLGDGIKGIFRMESGGGKKVFVPWNP
jgi:hypothetical protein